MLQDLPYEFFEANSPADGITKLKTHPEIQVIVLDLSFLGVTEGGTRATDDGNTVLEHIKERSSKYRVIVLTAHDHLLPASKADEFSVFNYLPKASRDTSQAIRFSIEQAFRDLDREEVERKNAFILAVQERIKNNEPIPETLDLICSAIVSTVGAYTCHIRVYDWNLGDYHLGGFGGADEALRQVFARPRAQGELFSGTVAVTGKPELFDNLQSMPEFRRRAADACQAEAASVQEREYWQTVRSAYIVPIRTGVFGSAVDAMINVSSQSERFFTDDIRTRIDEFVTLAVILVTKDWLLQRRQKVDRDYSGIGGMLSDISEQFEDHDVIASIFDVVTQSISKLVNPEIVSIFLYNEETRLVENVAELRGRYAVATPRECYSPGQSLTGAVFAAGETCQLPAAAMSDETGPTEDKRIGHANEKREIGDIPSGALVHFLGVPIRIGGHVRGVLRAVNKKSAYYDDMSPAAVRGSLLQRGFSADDRNAMEIIASHLAVAMRNAELLDDRNRQVEQLRTIGEVGRLINSALNINDVLQNTIRKLAEVMQAELCMLFLKAGDGRIVLRERFGFPATVLKDAFYDIGENVTGQVAATGNSRLIERPSEDIGKYDAEIRAFLTAKHKRPADIESIMVVPITAKGEILGAMKVVNRIGALSNFTQRDLELFETFASYVGVAIDNAQLYRVTRDELVIHKRNAALSSLVSAVAHEINNTSGLIPANVAGIRAQLAAPSDNISRRLALIERVANQATDFANQIAGFAAARQGERRHADVNAILRSSIADLQDLPKYKNSQFFRIEIAASAEPLVCAIFANPFAQIVRNIVINAWQALEGTSGGALRIATAAGSGPLAGFAVLRFQDNGPGILPEHIEKIFDPDFTTKPSGNGVGLWLVRTQLEQIGGSITVQSEPGKGATFIVSIPLATDGVSD
jgi:signal transduction histidine kinase/CheY-like chemotaxis protein